MGVNVNLMSLTTPVQLLTPQSINSFGGVGGVLFLLTYSMRTRHTLPRSHCELPTAMTTTQKLWFSSQGCPGFVRDGYHWWTKVSGVGDFPWQVGWVDAGEHVRLPCGGCKVSKRLCCNIGYRAIDTVASPIGTPDEKTCRAGPSHAVWSAAKNAPVQPSDPLKQPGPSLPSFLSPQVTFTLQKSQKLPKQQMPSPPKEHQRISPSTVKRWEQLFHHFPCWGHLGQGQQYQIGNVIGQVWNLCPSHWPQKLFNTKVKLS